MINTTIKTANPLKHKTDCLIVLCVEESKPTGISKDLNKNLNGAIAEAFRVNRFMGKPKQTLVLNSRKLLNAGHVILAGVGKAEEVNEEIVRQTCGTAAKLCERSRFGNVSFVLDEGLLPTGGEDAPIKSYDSLACAVAEGIYLSLYHFDPYKTQGEDDDPPFRVSEITLLSAKASQSRAQKGADRAQKISQGVFTSRDLSSHPGNKATPTFLADTAKKIAGENNITCKVLGPKEMKRLGMGALLGVAQGSAEPPALIVLEYHGGRKKDAPVVIVGKGITFDTGGISIKPSTGMHEMKMDMSGGAVTIGTLQAAACLQLPINVVGIVPAAENMPGGSAIKPGDILTSMSGKTIEVLNTDAEGRLVLADALGYAGRYKPKAVIDLATLTGAVVVALGSHAAAVLGNDSGLIERLIDSGKATGERLWELPLWAEYEKAMESSIADLKNIAAPGVGAGSILGAIFLKAFAGEQPWSHLDIAGTSWFGEDRPYTPKGASGFGVRLLLHYLEQEASNETGEPPEAR